MEVFNNKGECCGCGLCTTVCKKNAIVMKEDSKGFIYPEINEWYINKYRKNWHVGCVQKYVAIIVKKYLIRQ